MSFERLHSERDIIGFHHYRGDRWNPKSIYDRIWAFLDRIPLRPSIDRFLRIVVYHGRRVRFTLAARWPERDPKGHGARPVPRHGVLKSEETFQPLPLADASAWFARVHAANERLWQGNGSWIPHSRSRYAGHGVLVEDVALRVLGYFGAYEATGEGVYAARAEAGIAYLLRDRIFQNGHMLLQGHLVPDLPYAFAGVALLKAWRKNPRPDVLDVVRRVGDRLIEYPISGSVNHACAPVWLLAPLYRETGEPRYLREAVQRVRRTALAFQLPYGGWRGHEAWTWYHGITTKALLEAYTSLPFQPPHYPLKDQLAEAIAAAMNRLVLAQESSGRIEPDAPLTSSREAEQVRLSRAQEAVVLDGNRFKSTSDVRLEAGGYEMSALVAAHALLGIDTGAAHGLARHLSSLDYFTRLGFNTYAAGKYLRLLTRIAGSEAEEVTSSRVQMRLWNQEQSCFNG